MPISLTDHGTIKQANVENIKNYMSGEAFASTKGKKNIDFVIHYYQREYEWDDNNVLDLLDTIYNINLFDQNELNLGTEIGNLIIQPITEEKIFILDGQQRTTTISFIAIYLEQALKKTIASLRSKARKELELQDKQMDEIDELLNRKFHNSNMNVGFLTEMLINSVGDKDYPKINFINSPKYFNFYNELLNNRMKVFDILAKDTKNKDKEKELIKLLNIVDKKEVDFLRYTLDSLYTISIFFNDKLKIKYDNVSKLYVSTLPLNEIDSLINKFFNVLITIETISNKVNSSIIFQNKNNKGKGLSSLDLIKNTFILAEQKIDPKKEPGKEINDFFRNSKDILGENNFNKYIYSLFRIKNPTYVKTKTINSIDKLTLQLNSSSLKSDDLSSIKNDNWTLNKTFNFYNELKNNIIVYKKIKGIENSFPVAKNYLNILDELAVLDLYIPILLKFYPENENDPKQQKTFLKILKDIIKLYFVGAYNNDNNSKINNNVMNTSALPEIITSLENGKELYNIIYERLNFNKVTSSKLIEKWEDFNSFEARKGILHLYELSFKYKNIDELDKAIIRIVLSENTESEHIIPKEHEHLNIGFFLNKK